MRFVITMEVALNLANAIIRVHFMAWFLNYKYNAYNPL